jgi:hypothetical protein
MNRGIRERKRPRPDSNPSRGRWMGIGLTPSTKSMVEAGGSPLTQVNAGFSCKAPGCSRCFHQPTALALCGA